MSSATVEHPKVVSQAEWVAARKAHLAKEKKLTRAYDELMQERRELPWVRVEKNYVFDGPNGKETLADLFAGRSQLIIKHFMFGPGWKDGCVGCSFGADHLDGALQHIERHDVKLAAVSRAPVPEIEAFKNRMGWGFKWVSSYDSDFNYDYHASFPKEAVASGKGYYNYEETDIWGEEMSGLSVFYKNAAGEIFHTYSCYARGDEKIVGAYMLLDITPKGRNETGPRHNLTDWVRHHDRYDAGGSVDSSGRAVPSRTDAGAASAAKSACGCDEHHS
ncbi:MAG: thioredoxin family protein [Candidatus Acidiferrales bacterium]